MTSLPLVTDQPAGTPLIEYNANGDAVFAGTDIEVHRIAALLDGGMLPIDIAGDYPSLSLGHVEVARDYAARHPHTGRPYPPLTAKAALRRADFSRLDLDA